MVRPKEREPLEGEYAELNQWWWDAYNTFRKSLDDCGVTDRQKRALEYTENYIAP